MPSAQNVHLPIWYNTTYTGGVDRIPFHGAGTTLLHAKVNLLSPTAHLSVSLLVPSPSLMVPLLVDPPPELEETIGTAMQMTTTNTAVRTRKTIFVRINSMIARCLQTEIGRKNNF